MIIVQGFLRVRPEDVALFSKRLALHAALVQSLDGCIQYSIASDVGEPGLLWIGERWRDKAAQGAHMGGDHMAAFNNLMKHMPLSAAHIVQYECADEGQWLMKVGTP